MPLLRPYQLVREMTAGGQADSVVLALDHRLGRRVVIKRCKATRVSALNHEFQVLAGLKHPNVVEALDLFTDAGQVCLVVSHAPGPGFLDWAAADLSGARVARGAAAVARALAYIHDRGIVHRDLKPDNIRVGEGELGRLPAARLIDFGLAREPGVVEVVGSRGYIAPEVLDGQPAGPAADRYALGAVLLAALTDAPPPMPAKDPSTLWSRVANLQTSRPLAELILDLLQHDPTCRPELPAVIDTLGTVAGEHLALSPADLAADYFPHPPFVGRGRHLAQAEMALETARDETRLLRLDGGGKTAFCQQVSARARLAGFDVLEAMSLEALLVATGSAHRQDESSPQLASRIVDGLLTDDPGRPLLVTLSLPTEARQQAIAAVVHDQLGRATERGARRPLLVLWDGPAPRETTASWPTLELPPLSAEQASALVRRMLHHLPEPVSWHEQVHPLVGGDPRQVVALVERQIQRGLPDRIDPREPVEDPEAANRVASLSKAQRCLLAAVARSPRALPAAVLGEVVSPETLDALGSLLARGLLAVTPLGVDLSSATIGQAVQCLEPADDDGGDDERSVALHWRYAHAWASQPDPPPEVVGYHLLRAGAPHLKRAAALLADAPATSEALLAELVERLEGDDPARVIALTRLARIAGRDAEGLDRALELASTLALDAPDQAALLRAEVLVDGGHAEQALAELGKPPDGDDAVTVGAYPARWHLLRARAMALLGDFGGAEQEAARGRRVGPQSPSEDAELGNVLGLAATYLGRDNEAIALLSEAEAHAREASALAILARVLNSSGIALQRLGRLDEAAGALRACAALHRQLGDLRLAAACALNLGALAFRRMDLVGALEHYRHAADLGHRGALEATSAWAAASEANLLLLFGDATAAEACLDRAEASSQGVGRALEGHLLLYRAEARRLGEQIDDALELVARARATFAGTDRPGQDAALLLQAELQLLAGDAQASRASCGRLLERMAISDPDRWRAELIAGKAALADTPPDPRAALEALEAALAGESPPAISERHWEIQAALAESHARLGDRARADGCLRRAHEARAALRRRLPPSHRQAFDSRPDVVGCAEPEPDQPPRAGMRRLLEINRELGRALNECAPPEQLLHRILDGAIELAGAERGFILLRRGERLRVVASRNLDHEPVRRGVEKLSRTIAEQALASDEPVVVADALSDERFRGGLSVSALRLRAVLCVPLRVKDQAGALYMDNRFGTAVFDAEAIALARAFADQAGIVMQSARMLDESKRQSEQLGQAKAELEAANRQLSSQVKRQSEQLGEITVRLQHHEEELIARYNAANLIGRAAPMRTLFSQIDRVAASDAPIFIHGESGTGKELVARALHQADPARRDEPFVAINCGAIPASLLESELFGHVRGAFTGAQRDRPGVFEAAGAGTLLLDEVGDMDPTMQVKLLRVLQEGTFRRLGDDRERRSGCRVLSASHRRLARLVKEGRFREDLFYRLNVVELHVPPLRQRREDIPLLVQFFLQQEHPQPPPTIATPAMRALYDHDWPGNVRQLENELKRAALLSDGSIDLALLSPEIAGRGQGETIERQETRDLRDRVQRYERRLIEEMLAETGFNVSEAARRLGLHRVLLHRKIRLLGIVRGEPS